MYAPFQSCDTFIIVELQRYFYQYFLAFFRILTVKYGFTGKNLKNLMKYDILIKRGESVESPVVKILEYGIFDSNTAFPQMKITRLRTVDCYELELYAADHAGQSCMDGVWHQIRCGTFICAKPGQTRRSKLPFRCYYVHLQTADPGLRELLEQLPSHFEVWQLQELVKIFNEILTVESTAITEDRLLVHDCLLRLIRHISRYKQPVVREGKGKVITHQKALLAVEDHIRQHLDAELPLAELARQCSLSPVYFHTVFTAYFHKTPAQYILDCRIAAAKTALLADECSIAELAARCGFSSQSYFSFKFKQVTGRTPLQYRKEMLGRLQP